MACQPYPPGPIPTLPRSDTPAQELFLPASNRLWLPTTPGQSAVVYTLTALFMLNTTVLMLLVSGELSPANTDAFGPIADATPEHAPASVETTQYEKEAVETPVVVVDEIEAHVEAFVPAPKQATPAPVIQVVNEPAASEPAVGESQQHEPEEQPIQFFGLDVD